MSLERIAGPTDEPTDEPISLQLAWAHLHIDPDGDESPHDVWLTEIGIPAARQAAEDLTERSFAPQTWRLSLDSFPRGPVLLDRGPVVEVLSVSYIDRDGVRVILPTSDYLLDAASSRRAWLRPVQGWPSPAHVADAVAVEFRTGPAEVAAVVKDAMLMMLGHMFKNRDAVTEKGAAEVQHAFRDLLAPHRVNLGV